MCSDGMLRRGADGRLVSLVRHRQLSASLLGEDDNQAVYCLSDMPLYFAGEVLPSLDPHVPSPFPASTWCLLSSPSLGHFLHLMHLTILMACSHQDESEEGALGDKNNPESVLNSDGHSLRSASAGSSTKGSGKSFSQEGGKATEGARSPHNDSDSGSGLTPEKSGAGSV